MDWLKLLQYLLLGFIQGFTEPLPISSSAHVLLTTHLLKIENPSLDLEIVLNFASFIAILVVMLPKIKALIGGVFQKETRISTLHWWYWLIIASIPTAIVGYFFKSTIEHYCLNLISVGIMLLLTSLFLFIISKIHTNDSPLQELTGRKAFVIGLFQAFALVPGLSRSGTTMFGGTIQKVRLAPTLEFSFLLYLIASLGSMILSFQNGLSIPFDIYLISAFLMSTITTYLALRWFFKVVFEHSLKYFAIYVLVLGIILLIMG